jgi:hypothetical protein
MFHATTFRGSAPREAGMKRPSAAAREGRTLWMFIGVR